ncbi:MAG: ATP-binding protein [Clostridia bacterium]|nr:ATP-binding protein [Clostridia bacterium]
MEQFTIIPRQAIMDRILSRIESNQLLFVVGVRRSGKSCIAAALEQQLTEKYGDSTHVVRINFERINSGLITQDMLLDMLREQCNAKENSIILLDEVTHVVKWEQAINKICQDANWKLVLFSSNRRIISHDLDKVKEGKYDVVSMLPLSLNEFIKFQCFREITPPETPVCQKQYARFDAQPFSTEDVYKYYIKYGGLPVLKPEYMENELAWVVNDGSYAAAVTHDILEIGSRPGESVVTDPALLRSVITIMAKSIGDNISASWIGKQTQHYLGRVTPSKTIESYLRAILNAHLFYVCDRFDIKIDRPLKTLAKYYIVDAGLHNYVTGIQAEDECRLLENKVFFEFIRRGYDVFNGKLGSEEVDLIAGKDNERVYVQVMGEDDGEKEKKLIDTLRRIRNHYPKIIIEYGGKPGKTRDGIIILNAMEFLMGASWND